jgi:endoglucanase
MKNYPVQWGVKLLFTVLCLGNSVNAQTPVERFGQLKVSGNKILAADNSAAQLRGMSLYWSQWIGKYYNASVVKWVKDDWCADVVRAAMAVDNGGYLTSTSEKDKIFTVIDAAIANGLYVIVDWHIDNNAPAYITQAKTFFTEVATKYGNKPNIIYELWNEPLNVSWSNVIKPYHNEMVQTIRAIDPDNLIICGTRNWSQRVDEAAADPVTGTNIAYTLHFYANSHGQSFRDYCTTALNKNVAVFVTEYGTCDASGDGTVNAAETNLWWTYLDNNKISYCNWAISDKAEAAAALKANSNSSGSWSSSDLTTSGTLVRNYYKSKCQTSSNYKIYKTGTPVVIDGTMDAAWTNASVLPASFNNLLVGTVSSTADLSGSFKALWDNNYLYILGDVKDDTKMNDSQNAYDDDAVEVFVDINNDKATTYAANDVSYSFGWNDGVIIGVNPSGRATTNISYSMTAQTGGYVFESRIPWSTLQASPAVGQLLGFDFHVNDDDDGGTRDGKLGWTSTTDLSWQNPSLFGTAILEDLLPVISGMNEFNADVLSVYPNPVQNQFVVEYAGAAEFKLYDLQGRVVLAGNMKDKSEIDVSACEPGMYLISVTGNSGRVLQRIVKE